MNYNQKCTFCQPQPENTPQEAVCWMEQHPEIFGPPMNKEAVLEELREDGLVYSEFQKLSEGLKEELLSFCMGVRGMQITYDPMFKFVFDPEQKPERLEEFLSLCLGETVRILKVIPNESKRLTEEGSLLVMDILVCLETGVLVNVEIQRMGYLFPGARCACYSSDLVMRQYSQVREEKRQQGARFSYQDIKRVYTIVLIQKSTEEFHQFPEQHLHYARQTFNTGLELDLLQEYLLIPLDIFRKYHHNISNKLDAWLLFIASEQPQDIRKVMEVYPEFTKLYREVFQFRYQKEELVSMYSDALRILDANTTQYMIELQQEEIERLKEENQKREDALQEKDRTLQKWEKALRKQEEEIKQLQELLSRISGKEPQQ